ncbi:Hypothetical predicted protein [Paramuricea clavata]|uniref:Uncharacterized protein n=1 Tax=Paramuricea clavata TaxID=317549 RepID=A0A7D9HU59_PARCT|nr:Hypothetical predicted protein [Paramuricea clavata]
MAAVKRNRGKDQLRAKGFSDFTLKEVVNEMKKLRQKYKSEKDKTKKLGNGRSNKWLFFEQMDRFLCQRHNITPVALVDTMAESEKMDRHSDSLDDDQSIVESLVEKYGKGENFIRKCQTCDYEKTIHTGGVHCSEGGSLSVYDEEEEFYCPNYAKGDGDDGNVDDKDDKENQKVDGKKGKRMGKRKRKMEKRKKKMGKRACILVLLRKREKVVWKRV